MLAVLARFAAAFAQNFPPRGGSRRSVSRRAFRWRNRSVKSSSADLLRRGPAIKRGNCRAAVHGR